MKQVLLEWTLKLIMADFSLVWVSSLVLSSLLCRRQDICWMINKSYDYELTHALSLCNARCHWAMDVRRL